MIKTYNPEHTFVRVDQIREANSTWLRSRLVDVLRENPQMKPKGISHELKKYGVNPPYMQLYLAKRRAMDIIEGNHGESYGKLGRYAEMVRQTNPGSLVKIEYQLIKTGEDDRNGDHTPATLAFRRIYIPGFQCCENELAGCNQFQVQDKNTLYTVSLDTWTCDCRVWEVTGIPCRHAKLAIAHKRDKLESFTHPSFSKENYMKAYSHMIQAIHDPQFWPPMTLEPATILPPPLKRLLGRPRVNRRREVGEDGAVKRSGPIKCSKCFRLGHNTRTCQRSPVRQRKKRRSSQ
ncbi:hypothetical protein Salat_0918800 [Sesamum alatum]|uniref:SWIM-type domain-containing protein n=1 Tax=Sesamum alatum TaxID=300844 RepID=A0AAE2CRA2_9LAMI|nr:hypothetical protein Salat_0918800 [Sesamum alatum]